MTLCVLGVVLDDESTVFCPLGAVMVRETFSCKRTMI